MIVMPANNAKLEVGYLAGKFPGKIGHLYSPGGYPKRLYGDWLPYALDNGRYGAFMQCKESGADRLFGSTWEDFWNESAFIAMLDHFKHATQQPRWLVVPDVVGDRDGTLLQWDLWADQLRSNYGFPLAFAVQDGMTPDDVPSDADVVFVGGSTHWKWLNYDKFPKAGFRTHVGRVNGYAGLVDCHLAGIESCDGTGWFRGDKRQLAGLHRYLDEATSGAFGESMVLMQRGCE